MMDDEMPWMTLDQVRSSFVPAFTNREASPLWPISRISAEYKVACGVAPPGLVQYAHCAKVILVCDNLNTHTIGAFYEAFEPERARQLVRRIEFRHTPKHGSWLNIAENELSSLTRQCVADKRFGDIETLREETAAWSTTINESQRGVDWQMKITDARCKLKSVYPKIKT
jgi:DDE superfamily endonuclease